MRRAVLGLRERIDYVYIDGKFYPDIPNPGESVIRGDQNIPVVSAASILAKVSRDRQMVWLDRIYPQYGLSRHKGYQRDSTVRLLKHSDRRRSIA